MSRGRFDLDYLDLPHYRQQKKITNEIGRRWRRLYLRDAALIAGSFIAARWRRVLEHFNLTFRRTPGRADIENARDGTSLMSRGKLVLDYFNLTFQKRQRQVDSEIGRRWRRLYIRDAVSVVSNYLAIAMLVGLFSYAMILEISTAPKNPDQRAADNNSRAGQTPTYVHSPAAPQKKP
jgi:hypothetical protein